MRPLALHHMSAMDASPFELVALAAKNGLQGVIPFLYVMPHPKFTAPTVQPHQRADFLAHMKDNNITMGAMETMNVLNDMSEEMERYKPALETAQFLGAKRGVVHVRDSEYNRAVENFGQLCDFVKPYGLTCVIEFARIDSGCTKSMHDTMKLLQDCGRSNCGFAHDFLHVMRNGELDYAKTLDPKWFGYGQINDGPLKAPEDQFDEAVHNRGIPGTGEFPLIELIKAAPIDLPFDIEVPQHRARAAGVSVEDRVATIVTASRKAFDRAGGIYNR